MNKKSSFFSQRGSLTVQFLFGFVLVSGFVAIFSAVSLTLAVSEITQYITYASSRQLFLAHGDREAQMKEAREKYESLRQNQSLKNFFSAGWFVIRDEISQENGLGLNRSFQVSSNRPNLFFGVWTNFEAKLLDIDIPLWGGTTEEGDLTKFSSVVGSYLGRESTMWECKKFNDNRFEQIRIQWQRYSSIHPEIDGRTSYRNNSLHDNGC